MFGTWNWLDWTLVAVTLVSVVAALSKGLIRELIALASVVAGVILAALGYQRIAVWIEDLTRSHEVALGVSFLTLFLGTLALGALVSAVAKKLVKTAGIEWFDRFLGGVFGLIRGVVIDCILLMALVAFAIKAEVVHQSSLAPYVTVGARVMALAMPDDLKTQFRGGFEKFRQAFLQADKRATKD
jgi:membrane protein required for colicin V production